MEQKKHWWQELPLTISAVQCNLGDPDEWVLDEYVSKGGFNTEQLLHLVAKGHMGYFSEAKDGENLDAYLKKSRRYGIREIVYHNVHCINAQVAAEHPDWLQLEKDGSPMPAYSVYYLNCVNPSGPWHQNFRKELEALCSHDIDGVFLDGPVMRDNGCYCKACQADFQKKFGHSIYEATRLELQEMRINTVVRHVKDCYETVKRINPEIALYLNNAGMTADITGSNTRRLSPYVDLLGTEGGFQRMDMGPDGLWKVSANAKYIEAMIDDPMGVEKPLVCFFAGNMSGAAYYMHTPAETELTYAKSYANGSNIWYGVHFSASEFKDTEAAKTAIRMNNFVLDHKDVFGPTQTCARIALMWSQDTANNYAASVTESDFTSARGAGFENRGDHRGELYAQFDMLARGHVQFDIVDEESIRKGKLASYDALILPGVACMAEDVADAIRSFVAEGGNLLGNFDTALYTDEGALADGSRLADVFGFRGLPKIYRSEGIGNSYLFKTRENPLLDSLSFPRITAPILNARWEMDEDVQVLMEACVPMPSTYASLPEERYPAVTKHPYGKGVAYYICGNFGQTAKDERNILDYGRLLRRFCQLAARPVVESDEPGLYEVVLRRQGNRFLLHIINMTGAMERSIDRVVPLHDVAFRLNLEGFGIEKENYKISTVRGSSLSDVEGKGNELSFKLDKLNTWEIIVIE